MTHSHPSSVGQKGRMGRTGPMGPMGDRSERDGTVSDGSQYHHAVTTTSTGSESETAAVGRDLAGTLAAGDVVLLYGDLGAGKTAFVKGLAGGLGIGGDEGGSPTFTPVQENRGGRPAPFPGQLFPHA